MTRKKKTPKAANGHGSVRWYPSAWRYVGQVKRDGRIVKRVYGTRGERSPAEQIKVWAELKPYLNLPAEANPTASVQAYMDAYADRGTLVPRTRDCYRQAAKYLARLGAKRLIDITPGDIRVAVGSIAGAAKRGKTMNRTRQIAYTMLHGIFEQALRERIVAFNPVDAVTAPKYQREEEPVVFTPEEQSFLCEAARGTACEAFLLLALTVPMRTCELLALRRRDVNLSKREVEIRNDLVESKETGYKPTLGAVKTPQSRREVPLSDEAAAFTKRLQAQLATGRATPDSLVFTSSDGTPVRHSNVTRRWWKPLLTKAEAEKAAHKAGDRDYRFPVHAGLYDLRHTAFENMNAAGVPLDVMHKLAGHANVSTSLKHYSKPSEERRRAAVDSVSRWLQGRAVATR